MHLTKITIGWFALTAFCVFSPAQSSAAVGGSDDKGLGVHAVEEPFMLMSDMPPPPDYERVMEEEFQGAVAEGTSSALIRFIARYPDHPLADRARSLLSGRDGPDPGISLSDPDADIYAAFDQAHRQNTVAAFNRFIAAYPNHPLSAEARRRISELQRGEQ